MEDHYYRIENRDQFADEPPSALEELDKYTEKHRKRIEPWLSSVFQSEHLSLLVGSGLSTALAYQVGAQPVTMAPIQFSGELADPINKEANRVAAAIGRSEPNIEDQVRAADALAYGLQIVGDERGDDIRQQVREALFGMAQGIVTMEAEIAAAGDADDEKRRLFQATLTGFLLSFASRTPTRDRLSVFTTNYDRILEYGFDIAGIRPIDRFVGQLNPVFRSSRLDVDFHYSPPGNSLDARPLEGVIRYGKLHGSVDWLYEGKKVVRLPSRFGKLPSAISADTADGLMIFPNAAKDFETSFFPYAEIFRDFSASICRPNSALIVYGYGFGDDHINRVLSDMLSLPSTHLVIIAFGDVGGRIRDFVENEGRPAQVSMLKGPHFADIEALTRYYLPKPAIDHISIRRTELVGRRELAEKDASPKPEDTSL